ncbi:MAG: ferredoxin [Candidatus Aminicenantes bacterium]|nr:MAG: ferredoxin [Candidatus Aminicenantes bacterium]
MAITKVWIEDGCIVCGVCEASGPEVFEMGEETAVVKEGVNFNEYEEQIKEAAENCPVEVIQYE